MAKTETIISTDDDIPAMGKGYEIAATVSKQTQYLGLKIDRTGWTDKAQRLKMALWASLDGGVTWVEWCSYVDQGGNQHGPKGEVLMSSSFEATPPPEGALLSVVATAEGKTVSQPLKFVEVA